MGICDRDDLAREARGGEDPTPEELRAKFAAFLDELRWDLYNAEELADRRQYKRVRTLLGHVREKLRAASQELRP